MDQNRFGLIRIDAVEHHATATAKVQRRSHGVIDDAAAKLHHTVVDRLEGRQERMSAIIPGSGLGAPVRDRQWIVRDKGLSAGDGGHHVWIEPMIDGLEDQRSRWPSTLLDVEGEFLVFEITGDSVKVTRNNRL